jgi:pilus assembly protein FimV
MVRIRVWYLKVSTMLKNTYSKHPSVIIGLCAAIFASYSPGASAVGLGQVRLDSALGQPLRAYIPLIEDAGSNQIGTCFNARLSSADGAFIASPRVAVTPGSPRGSLTLSTVEAIGEPALTLVIEMLCRDGLRREFSLLLDPPMNAPSSPIVSMRTGAAVNANVIRMRSEQLDGPTGRSPRLRPQITQRSKTTLVDIGSSATPQKSDSKASGSTEQGSRTANGKIGEAQAEKPTTKTSRNVLQLSSSDPKENDLVNAIGLRLAHANSVEATAVAASMAKMEDPAKAAASRAAQAQFAAVLRGEPTTDTGQGTSQKLEQLIAKMSLLEAETDKLRKDGQRDAAALKASQEKGLNGMLLPILGALLLLSIVIMAWLVLRLKYLNRQSRSWNWEQKASEAGADVGSEGRREGSLSQNSNAALAPQPLSDSRPQVTGLAAQPLDVGPSPATKSTSGRDKKTKTVSDVPFTAAADMAPFLPTTGVDEEFHNDHRRVDVLAVEEISDVMQEAEFWISLHDGQRAIEVLEPYATVDHPSSPLPWLYLFDLYAELGQQAKYEMLHERFLQVFNSKIPSWDEHIAGGTSSVTGGIENVPHILERICDYWQTDQVVPYLESLLLDDRDGTRGGFDLIVYREIMFLIAIAYELQQPGNAKSPPSRPSDLTLVA